MATESEHRSAIASRLNDTRMQGFHQIVALSQDVINTALCARWADEINEEGLAKFKATLPRAGNISMSAEMTAPTIELVFKSVEHEHYPPILYFNLNFVSGAFDYYSGFGPEAVKHSANLDQWKLAFKVDLSLERLSTRPQELDRKILVTGKYDLNQLLLQFGDPDLIQFDRSKSTIPGSVDHDRDFFLGRFMKNYITYLQGTGKTVLGYALTVLDPKIANPEAPSFPPTLVKHQTMPYKSSSDKGSSGRNMFMFLEMTGENPKFPAGPLKMSGNWVTPRIHATMAICKSNFWDGYLFEHLKPFNGTVLDLVNRLKICAEKEARLPDDEKFEWNCSTNHPKRPSDDSLSWVAVANGAEFSWKGHYYGSNYDIKTDFKNELGWTSGSNQIKLNVHIHLQKQQEAWGAEGGVNVTDIYIDRELTLTLESVLDGRLKVHVQETSNIRSEGYTSWMFLQLSCGQVPERLKKLVEARLLKENLVSGIQAALNGQRYFVFPGGGTFLMKNPLFNAEGDLLIELNYKQD